MKRKDLKTRAKARFKANYWRTILVTLIIGVISGAATWGITVVSNVGTVSAWFTGKGVVRSNSGTIEYDEDGICDEDGNISFHIGDGDEGISISAGDGGAEVHIGDGNSGINISAGDGGTEVFIGDGEDGINISAKDRGTSVRVGRDIAAGVGTLLPLIGVYVVMFAAIFGFLMMVAAALEICVFNPLMAGGASFYIENLEKPSTIGRIGSMFCKKNYGRCVGGMFLMQLFTFLWSLLFIVPGIIKSYEYRMIPYLIVEHPEMTRKEIFAKSKEMMYGYKWKAFVLDLSFIGWGILSLLTLGILGIFYVNPYIYQTNAALYDFLKHKDDNKEVYESYVEVQ